jgi:glycopeptide antibiotics resistance protein
MAIAWRWIAAIILAAYGVALVRLLVFKNVLVQIGPFRFRFDQETGPANFLPFKTISSYLLDDHVRLIAILNLAGNVLLFVPIGFLAAFLHRKMTWPVSVVLGVVAGLAIEGMEAMLRAGVFDVDDLILNALGVTTGYGTSSFFFRRTASCPTLG